MKNSSINNSSFETSTASIKIEDLTITNQVKEVGTYKITAADQKPAQNSYKIKLTDSDKALLERLDMEHRAKLLKEADVKKRIEAEQLTERSQTDSLVTKDKTEPKKVQLADSKLSQEVALKVVSVPNPKSKLKVN